MARMPTSCWAAVDTAQDIQLYSSRSVASHATDEREAQRLLKRLQSVLASAVCDRQTASSQRGCHSTSYAHNEPHVYMPRRRLARVGMSHHIYFNKQRKRIMHKLTRLLLLGSLTVVSLAIMTGAASANRSLELRPGGAITLTASGTTTLAAEGGANVLCTRLTLRGTLVTRIAKAGARRLPEGRIGAITEGTSTGCTGPFGEAVTAVVLAEPRVNGLRHPFELRYDSFQGTLPNINGILVTALRAEFSLNPLAGARCVFVGDVGGRIDFPAVAAGNTGAFLTNTVTLVAALSDAICPRTGELRQRFVITPRQTVALL